MLGKQDNCQVAVSISLACEQGSLPVAWQLYLPEDWARDAERRRRAGVPDTIGFATKTQIALQQLRSLLAEGAPRHCVLADAGYGVDTAFRQSLSEMGLLYAVGITDLPPTSRTRLKLVKSVNHQENDGHEEEQIHRGTDHRLPQAGRGRHADQGAVPQWRFQ